MSQVQQIPFQQQTIDGRCQFRVMLHGAASACPIADRRGLQQSQVRQTRPLDRRRTTFQFRQEPAIDQLLQEGVPIHHWGCARWLDGQFSLSVQHRRHIRRGDDQVAVFVQRFDLRHFTIRSAQHDRPRGLTADKPQRGTTRRGWGDAHTSHPSWFDNSTSPDSSSAAHDGLAAARNTPPQPSATSRSRRSTMTCGAAQCHPQPLTIAIHGLPPGFGKTAADFLGQHTDPHRIESDASKPFGFDSLQARFDNSLEDFLGQFLLVLELASASLPQRTLVAPKIVGVDNRSFQPRRTRSHNVPSRMPVSSAPLSSE
jgi:hypothetical protein